MVKSTSSSTAVSRKRKKSTDMSDSPPKRVTRARAKANEDSELSIKTTKITTASARAAAASRTPAKPAKAIKRRARADDAVVDTSQEKEASYKVEIEAPKTRGRPRKTPDTELEHNASTSDAPPRTRSRLEKQPDNASEDGALALKAKGRPRKVVAVASTKNPQTLPVHKPARGEVTVKSKTLPTASILKPPVNRKTVTFKDSVSIDKENAIVSAKSMKAKEPPEPKATGLKAKPVRKPTVSRTKTRGAKSVQAEKTAADTDTSGKVPQPLSPKKVTQVAKSNSASSEDELCGEKTPAKILNKSPIKPPTTASKVEPMRMPKSAFTSTTKIVSPTRDTSIPEEMTASIFASPARRPPQSPFKDVLKDSPKKFNISSSIVQPALSSSQLVLKTSLLNSPARRPTSPTKTTVPGSPGKSNVATPFINTAIVSKQSKSFEVPPSTPRQFASNQPQAAGFTQQTLGAHDLDSVKSRTHTDEVVEDSQLERSCVTSIGFRTTPVENHAVDGLVKVAEPSSSSAMLQSPPTSPADTDGAQVEMDEAELTIEPMKEQVEKSSRAARTMPATTGDIIKSGAFSLAASVSRYTPEDSSSEDSCSEDELNTTSRSSPRSLKQTLDASMKDVDAIGTPTPSRAFRAPKGTLKHDSVQANTESRTNLVSMTPLATQLSSWLASSPEKEPSNKRRNSKTNSIFSFVRPSLVDRSTQSATPVSSISPLKSSFFEDEMAVRDQEKAALEEDEGKQKDDKSQEDDRRENEEGSRLDSSHESEDSEHYSDENIMPIDPRLLTSGDQPQISLATCTPAKASHSNLREVHTVSKVPLRPAGEESPIKISRKRSRSLSGPTDVTNQPRRTSAGHRRSIILHSSEDIEIIEYSDQGERLPLGVRTVENTAIDVPSTPTPNSLIDLGTPLRTVRKGNDAEILRGAVVYVDVHTSEGADASGIFVELLSQMGARCVKQWTWNPPVSLSGSLEGTLPSQVVSVGESTPTGRVGITHVVFKDGGKRTLEKVRDSKGLVLCVGVGWVLE